jgi:hypothetical protein
LRGADHVPKLSLEDYSPTEIAWDAEIIEREKNDSTQPTLETHFKPRRSFSYKVFGKTFKQRWEGEAVSDICLRVPEALPGGEVILTGFNFYDREIVVRIWDSSAPHRQWVLPALVLGDRSGLVRQANERIGSDDFSDRDVLMFRVPSTLEQGIYKFRVEVPNSVGYTWPTNGMQPHTFESNEKYLRVSPSSTRYRISVTSVYCEEETPGCGSDEVLISSVSTTAGAPGSPSHQGYGNTVTFNDVDSGDHFQANIILFEGVVANWISVGILGLEVDDADHAWNYQKSWEDLYTDVVWGFIEDFWPHLHEECWPWSKEEGGAPAKKAGPLVIMAGCYIIGAIAGIIATIVLAIFTLPWAIWAPADLLIEDNILLDLLGLNYLIDPWNPLQKPFKYSSGQGVKVSVQPLGRSKNTYMEKRTYECSDATYSLVFTYERLSAYVSPEVMSEALFGRMV